MGYAFVVISFVLYQFYKRLCCFRCWWQYYFVEAFVPRTCWSTCWSWIMFKKNFSAAIIKEIFMLLNKWNTFYLMNLWKAVWHFVLWITLIYYINITLLGERGVTLLIVMVTLQGEKKRWNGSKPWCLNDLVNPFNPCAPCSLRVSLCFLLKMT
jgi:hypothetical protein